MPPGVAYDPCFARGDCPDAVLQAIHDTPVGIRLVYLRVAAPPVETYRLPVRLVGRAWQPGAPTDATCPCGRFTAEGLMLGIEP